MKRSITLLFVVTAVILSSSSTAWGFGKNKIVYDEFDWKIYSSTHFDVYFYEEERDSLQKVVNLAESAYDEISRKFDFQITERIPLIYYETHSAFEQTNVILMFIPEGVGAFAEPGKNRMVLPIDLPDEKLYALLKHELTHIFEYEIIYQGSIRREMRANPPTWLMEGLASFMAEDEDTTDLMVLRDAVVNDTLPSINQPFGGFFAYRFGHAVFRFMEQKWGMEGVRDFIYEYRNSLGGSIERPLRRTFELSVEEFDTQFRTWLRKQYLPALIAKGEPTEYGKRFRVREGTRSQEMSPVPAPSGDLLASITTYKEDVDVVLFNVPERKLFRNLSKGYPDEYEYIIAQFMTTGPVMGRDIAFASDGDRIAFFVKKERGRYLMIVNALTGDIELAERMDVEQQLNPTFSPDGRTVAFHGFRGNQADIFTYDIDTREVTNLTADAFFDAAPVYSPDGRWLYYSSVVDGYAKLFRLDLNDPSKRYQLTQGDWNDRDAWVEGDRVFFSSDRPTGRTEEVLAAGLLELAAEKSKDETKTPAADLESFASFNVYSLDLQTGEVVQYTDVIGGAFTPVVFIGDEGKETLVFSSFYKGQWNLYSTPTDENLGVAKTIELPVEPLLEEERFEFLPPVEVALDEENIEDGDRFRLFIEDISVNGGVTSDQTLVSRSVIRMSDMLGNRRFIAALDSVSTFSNFDFLYLDLSKRWTWGLRLFDNRTFYVDPASFDDPRLERRRAYRITGALGLLSYPFDRYRRVEFGLGYMYRDIDIPLGQVFPDDGEEPTPTLSFSDDFPFVFSTFTGDSTVYKSFGPVSGRRYYVNGQYLADLDGGGTLSADFETDFRQYLQVTSRSLLAARVYAGYSEGNRPNFYYFGGLNTLRGYDFRSIVGNRAFYGNFEYRFPLIDIVATPLINIRDVRGTLFFDIGGAWFDGDDFEPWTDGRLDDALASVGWGLSFRFLGLELHWDFARRTDLDEISDTTETSFWIGQTF